MNTLSHRQRRRGGCSEEQRHDPEPEGRHLWGVSRKQPTWMKVDANQKTCVFKVRLAGTTTVNSSCLWGVEFGGRVGGLSTFNIIIFLEYFFYCKSILLCFGMLR